MVMYNSHCLVLLFTVSCLPFHSEGVNVIEWKAAANYDSTARKCIQVDGSTGTIPTCVDNQHTQTIVYDLTNAAVTGISGIASSIGTGALVKIGDPSVSPGKCLQSGPNYPTVNADWSSLTGSSTAEMDPTWENCCATAALCSTGSGGANGRQIWAKDPQAGTLFTALRLMRATNSDVVHATAGSAPQACLKVTSNALKVESSCGAAGSVDHDRMFKIGAFNWLASADVFEWKNTAGSQSAYDGTTVAARKCLGNPASTTAAFAQCDQQASITVITKDTTAMSGGNAVNGIYRLQIGTKCLEAVGNPFSTTTAVGSDAQIFGTCSTGGKHYWKPHTGTGSDWAKWQVQRETSHSAGADITTSSTAKTHCLSKDSTSLKIKGDCTSITALETFKFAGYGWLAAAGIMDDPEVTNIHKEKFKVNNKGGITLLHLPREAPIGKAYLVLVAEIQELYGWNQTRLNTKACTPTFVRNLLITGTALGELTAVTFHARNNTAPFLMGFGNKLIWLPDGKITESAIAHYTHDVEVPADVSFAITAPTPGYPRAIHLNIGSVSLTVRRPHIPEGRHWQFLNFQVNGLDSLKYAARDFGGVLGFDSPTKAASKHNTCLSSTRKWKNHTHADVSLAAVSGSILQMVGIDSDEDAQAEDSIAQA